jgi:uncharacterized protein (DUF302 family)
MESCMIKAGFLFSVAATAMAIGPGASATQLPSGPADLMVKESTSDVASTQARATAALAKLGVPVFATFDHATNASEAGLSLRPTVVLVFGNPKVGTKLMLDQQAMALDLPLRIAIWQDAQGTTWISYHDIRRTADAYGIKDRDTVAKLADFMTSLINQAAGDSTK